MTSDTRPRQNRAVQAERTHISYCRRWTVVVPSQARHASYSTADSKAFFVVFVVVSHVKRCFTLVHKALSSPFSTVFLFHCYDFSGGVATRGLISQSHARSDVAWYSHALWNINTCCACYQHFGCKILQCIHACKMYSEELCDNSVRYGKISV